MAILNKIYAERIICGKTDDDIEESKERIKESCNHIRTSFSMVKFLTEQAPDVFSLPVKDNDTYSDMLQQYNLYLLAVLDLHYHMIQVEYPFEKEMAYELASKMTNHCALLIKTTIKPALNSLRSFFKDEKEINNYYNYVNVLSNLMLSIKWLSRGLNHYKIEEKNNCYTAINEAKKIGQNCYDSSESDNEKFKCYYYRYIERWLEYMAQVYDHMKDIAEKVDFVSMEGLYDGPIFETESIIQKKDKIPVYFLENYEKYRDTFE